MLSKFNFSMMFFASLLFFSGPLLATEFFASTPSEITSALASAQPGDTVTLTNGIWTNQNLVVDADGQAGLPILIRAETPGQVILNGTSNLRIGGSWLVVDGLFFRNGGLIGGHIIRFNSSSGSANNCRLTNTAIVSYNPPDINTRYFWVSLYGTNNRVDHCYFSNQNHSGVTVVAWLDGIETNHRIDNNFFGNRPEGPENGWETIRIGTSGESGTNAKVTVENNLFYKCNGEIEIISNKSNENIYRNNTFVDCDGQLTLRHGKRCLIEGNFFFGYNAPQSSGVRIIDRDHVVINNYFAGLKGNGFRAALSITNGVPNSPLNRYFQVINSLVAFNTFVDCSNPLDIGTGKDDELSLPPLDNTIANNIVRGVQNGIITYTDTPINMIYEGNLMYGAPLGITPVPGISATDALLENGASGLLRPSAASPAIDSAAGNYPDITVDMDGQIRGALKDIGADEVSSDSIVNRPLTVDDVGPQWYPVPLNVIQVPPGHNTLSDSAINAGQFDVLVLSAGEYTLDDKVIVTNRLNIRAADSTQRPVIRNTNPGTATRILFEIQDGGSLAIDGLELDGMAGSATPAKYLIRTDDDPFTTPYVLIANNCYFRDVVADDDGNFFRAYAGTFADSLIFTNCLFNNSGKEGIRLRDEVDNSGEYNVDLMEIRNCTFWNTRNEAVYVYAGDNILFTPGPSITIDHVTFDNCGNDTSRILYLRECDQATVKNSLFTNSPDNSESMILDGWMTSVSYSDTFNVGAVSVNRGATIGDGMVNLDPLYMDRLNGDFTLANNSPVGNLGDDGLPLGDIRWARDLVAIGDPPQGEPRRFVLQQNFPNPFNPSTTIRFVLPSAGQVNISIYNIRGQLVSQLVDRFMVANVHQVEWQAGNTPSGIYFYRLEIDGKVIDTRKAILLK